ncbi:MAG: vanadium-dependent haloperoxidase [Bryobacteraceae bacterium]|nr:vanadium-dependent haloperoxidase [Bryobacteraceae bacterium]
MKLQNWLFTFIVLGLTTLRADQVTNWNVVAMGAALAAGQAPPVQTRTSAIVHIAIHDALNAIDRRNAPYALETRADQGAAPAAAVAAAARDTLIALIPAQRESIETAYSAALAEVSDASARASGVAIGQAAAALILSRRSADGANATAAWSPGSLPGQYRQTPPANAAPIVPHWGNVTPFALRDVTQYRVDPPPDLSVDQYAYEVNEVKLVGGATSRMRTDEQSEIARHWYEASAQSWNRIARSASEQQRLDLWENGRLFALVNIALADGYFANFESKYLFNFWRPVTAIRDGDLDGNLDTVGESDWNAFLNTPAIPEWPSGHATVGAAAAEVMMRFFHTDYLAFSLTAGPPFAGSARQYYSFSQAALENANSRVLAGIHFRASCVAGLAQGQRIGDYVYHNVLRPIR